MSSRPASDVKWGDIVIPHRGVYNGVKCQVITISPGRDRGTRRLSVRPVVNLAAVLIVAENEGVDVVDD